MTDRNLIIVSNIDQETLPGSIQIVADCGHEAMISVSGQNLLADDSDIETMCLRCLSKEVTNRPADYKDAEFKSAPGAREELNEAIGVSGTDQIFAALKFKELDGGTT